MSMRTAAISSSASVAEWNPPVSTSITTGRQPRNRRDINSAAGCSGCTTTSGTWFICARLLCDSPCNPLARPQWNDHFLAERVRGGDLPRLFHQRDPFFVARQVVEIRPELGG